MPQPGMNGMEPAFGEAYGSRSCFLSHYPLAVSPLGGRTEYDQSVLLTLGSPATPRKRPFELLSDLVDDGGFGEELHTERWDVSALDDITRYTKLGLGGELASAEDAVLMGRWGGTREEEEEEEERRKRMAQALAQQPSHVTVTTVTQLHGNHITMTPNPCLGRAQRGGVDREGLDVPTEAELATGKGDAQVGGRRIPTVEVYQVAEKEFAAEASAARAEVVAAVTEASGILPSGSALEHNYSLTQGGDRPSSETETEEEEEEGVEPMEKKGEEEREEVLVVVVEEEEEEEEDQDEEEDGVGDETTVEAELSSSSETECDVEPERGRGPGERPQKRRCFWEYRHAHARDSGRQKACGEVRWSLSWSSSTLPSTLYRREGKKGRRKARKTDASDLTPNPVKLTNIGEQLQKLNAAIGGMGPVNDLPVVARARSRKEKNKLASRACRLKKKAQHEANKIKLWGLNQEYENLLGALLRIKEVIRQRVESGGEEEDSDERGMTQRLEDILKESSGPLVAGRTKEFVQRILEGSGGGGAKAGARRMTPAPPRRGDCCLTDDPLPPPTQLAGNEAS